MIFSHRAPKETLTAIAGRRPVVFSGGAIAANCAELAERGVGHAGR